MLYLNSALKSIMSSESCIERPDDVEIVSALKRPCSVVVSESFESKRHRLVTPFPRSSAASLVSTSYDSSAPYTPSPSPDRLFPVTGYWTTSECDEWSSEGWASDADVCSTVEAAWSLGGSGESPVLEAAGQSPVESDGTPFFETHEQLPAEFDEQPFLDDWNSSETGLSLYQALHQSQLDLDYSLNQLTSDSSRLARQVRLMLLLDAHNQIQSRLMEAVYDLLSSESSENFTP